MAKSKLDGKQANGWRRVKPLLGTLLALHFALDAAATESDYLQLSDAVFARVAALQSAMSFHDSASELRALGRAPMGAQLRVSLDLWQVLAAALEIEIQSHGAFNVAVAPTLVAQGLLPWPDGAQTPIASNLQQAIDLLEPGWLAVRSPAWLDLGGIAKGYAVDAAVQILQAAGASQGMVNAGGDLRVFGPTVVPVQLRQPGAPGLVGDTLHLQNTALATSCRDFSQHGVAGDWFNGLIDPALRTAESNGLSVSVLAPTGLLADALTKVVLFAAPALRQSLLNHYGARAVVLKPMENYVA